MNGASLRVEGLSDASVEQKLALIDKLWESVRRSGPIEIRNDHLSELEKRVAAISSDPSLALTPSQARALLMR